MVISSFFTGYISSWTDIGLPWVIKTRSTMLRALVPFIPALRRYCAKCFSISGVIISISLHCDLELVAVRTRRGVAMLCPQGYPTARRFEQPGVAFSLA